MKMKKVILKSTLLLMLFTLVNLFFAIFNWKIFTVKLNINLGFGLVEFPPFIAMFLVGFLVVGILSWTNYNMRLRRMIYDLEHGMEIGKLKDRLSANQFKKLISEEDNLALLKDKLGIISLGEKLDDLAAKHAELQQRTTTTMQKGFPPGED
jgi:hypothetical protein